MKSVDKLLLYWKLKDRKILFGTNCNLSDYEINVVIVKILSWLKLEYKRGQTNKSKLKSLEVDLKYPWCRNLNTLLENEEWFSKDFSISQDKFDFSDNVNEEERDNARFLVYTEYNPQKHK